MPIFQRISLWQDKWHVFVVCFSSHWCIMYWWHCKKVNVHVRENGKSWEEGLTDSSKSKVMPRYCIIMPHMQKPVHISLLKMEWGGNSIFIRTLDIVHRPWLLYFQCKDSHTIRLSSMKFAFNVSCGVCQVDAFKDI